MTISILGCGWLGLPLGEQLVKDGHIVKGSTTTPAKLDTIRAAGIQPFLIKVEDDLVGNRLHEFFSTDLLILNIPPGRRDPDVEERHPQQIRAITEWVVAGEVKKLLFISSTGVYPNVNRVVTEVDDTNPERASTIALVVAENYLQLQNAFQTTILRMAGLVGGERKAGRFLAGKTDVANGNAPINLVHRDDCIQVIQKVISMAKWDEVYNVCADEHPTKKEFYIAQAYKENFEPPTFRVDEDEISFKIISNQKLKQELAYTFKHPDPMRF